MPPAPDFAPASPPIVCLGASAGGLRALECFFKAMPPDSGCSFVVVQHLSPDFRSLMDDLLARQTRMPIHHAEEGLPLAPNSIYLIPPKKLLTIQAGGLHLTDRLPDRQTDLPINVFLDSLAAYAGPRAIAVILSGTGTDGSEGIRAIHEAGGLVIAQTPETAEFDGMPRSALATEITDYSLAPEAMPPAILAYARDPQLRIAPAEPDRHPDAELDENQPSREFAAIFTLLKRSTGLDFSHYKIATVERRIHRRMALAEIQDPAAYALQLETRPAELDALYRDLLIGVTEFFRDPEAFATLSRLVYQPLFQQSGRDDCRVWIAGCATGEEAYSQAILLDEAARAAHYTGRISLFATDAHRTSLETASAGLYNRERLKNLSPERLARYFREEKNGLFRVIPELRQRIVFAPHNLLNDPPFTKLDAISCRNLLIYLSPPAQERVISLFHYALRRDAALLLGLSEGLGRLVNDYEVLDSKQKLFRKTRDSRLPLDLRNTSLPRPGRPALPLPTTVPHTSAATLPRGLLNAYDQLLRQHLPSGFILNEEGDILHYIGDAARYLAPLSGRAQENILARTTGDLRLALSTLLPKVLRDRLPAESLGLRIDVVTPAASEQVDLLVHPLPEDRSGARLLHVSLRHPRPAAPLPDLASPLDPNTEAFAPQQAHARRILDLEHELISTKENLQATVEELQTTNEELQAANEEMLAANEELQSTNEELHSVNEELYTVNAEFERKNGDLNTLIADLDNLLKATDSGTLFLDRDLRIRVFNPAIEQIFHLLPQDIGRPIEHIAYHIDDQAAMIREARAVLETGKPIEGEVRTRQGQWLLKRVLPFYATHRAIEGVVLTFTRIDVIKTMQDKLDLAMAASRLVWWEWDLISGRFQTHTNGTCILGYKLGDLAPSAKTWFDLTHPDDLAQVRSTLDACLKGSISEWESEHRYKDAAGKWRWVLDKGRVTERDATGRALRMLGTTQDVHDQRLATEEIAKLSHAIEQTEVSIVITDAQGTIEYVNPFFTRVTGYTPAEVIGQTPRLLKSEQTAPEIHQQLWRTISHGEPWHGELINRRKDGTHYSERVSISPIKDPHGHITHYIGIKEDVTAIKADQAQRARLEHQLAQSQKMETLGTLAGGIAHDFNNLLTSILGYTRLAQESISPTHHARPALEQIDNAGHRAADLVRRILAFSRNHTADHALTIPGRLFADAVPMLRSSLPTTIELQYHDESLDCAVFGDGTQLQQVLFNLCTNSAHSIGHQPGVIEIGLRRVEITTPLEVQIGSLHPGAYLRLCITDNGAGIDPAIQERIFEPFFTTKSVGEGSGLGLAIVHNTVLSHHGAITLRSAPRKGTTITVYLPALASAGFAPAFVPAATNAASPTGSGQRIAIIDDDTSIAQLSKLALGKAGYEPTVYARAEDCLAALRADSAAANLILTDQTMPGMTGLELAKALRKDGVTVPIIIASGYNRLIAPEALADLGHTAFLPKPFDLGILLKEVDKLLRPTS